MRHPNDLRLEMTPFEQILLLHGEDSSSFLRKLSQISFFLATQPPTPRYVQWAALLQTATLSIGERLRRRTFHVPRTVLHQRLVSTPGVAASHPSARVHRQSSWRVRHLPQGAHPTAR